MMGLLDNSGYDIINDENFVKEGQSNYRLASNVITITDEKAREFRPAA